MSKVCRDCGSDDLVPRGNGFRNRCYECHRQYQRDRYHANPNSLQVRRDLYQKHAGKRRAESAVRKRDNRTRYTLLEWFRKKGIPASEIPAGDIDALVAMKEALKASKI